MLGKAKGGPYSGVGKDTYKAARVMSIRFTVDNKAGIYVTTLDGVLSESDIRAAYATFYTTPDFRPELNRIIDLSNADISTIPLLGFEAMSARVVKTMRQHGRSQLRTAFVVPDDGNYAQIEVYKGIADNTLEEVALFRDADSARRWLLGD